MGAVGIELLHLFLGSIFPWSDIQDIQETFVLSLSKSHQTSCQGYAKILCFFTSGLFSHFLFFDF